MADMSLLQKSHGAGGASSMPWILRLARSQPAERGAEGRTFKEDRVHLVPPIDDIGRPIDELAFVLATDHLSTLEKIWLLEQWRYDALLVENGATEGLGVEQTDGA